MGSHLIPSVFHDTSNTTIFFVSSRSSRIVSYRIIVSHFNPVHKATRLKPDAAASLIRQTRKMGKKDDIWEHFDVVERKPGSSDVRVHCKRCPACFWGGATRCKLHVRGNSTQVVKCTDPDPVMLEKLAAETVTKAREHDEDTQRRLLENLVAENVAAAQQAPGPAQAPEPAQTQPPKPAGKTKQLSLGSFYKPKEDAQADFAVARWIYEAGIPFHVTQSKSFQDMLATVRTASAGYKPPSINRFSLLAVGVGVAAVVRPRLRHPNKLQPRKGGGNDYMAMQSHMHMDKQSNTP